MQDECGDTVGSLDTVMKGIRACSGAGESSHSAGALPADEGLLLRALRLFEKQNRLPEARQLILNTCTDSNGLDKVWKIIFEGAQMEARAGEIARARQLYRFLMIAVPWYGPIYLEAYRLEESGGHLTTCLRIISKGLHELQRYGPLWFGLLHIMERLDVENERQSWASQGAAPQLRNVRFHSEHAVKHISRELMWKVHFEMAQIEERAAEMSAQGRLWLITQASQSAPTSIVPSLSKLRNELLGSARASYAKSLVSCAPNLRWKVLLAGARMELSAGNIDLSRRMLREAFVLSPAKSRAYVYLDCARVEECAENYDLSRKILARARIDIPGEWKIFLESASQMARSRNFVGAISILVRAVDVHSGAGRLWALLIQLFSRAWRANSDVTMSEICELFRKSGASDMLFSVIRKSKSYEFGSRLREEADSALMSSLSLTDTESSIEGFQKVSITKQVKACIEGPRKCSPLKSSVATMCELRKNILSIAFQEVPKSGEVWCEAARSAMNPLSTSEFDLAFAHRSLTYAILFTPQYGDSFVELLKLELLCQVFLPKVLDAFGIDSRCFIDKVFDCDVPESREDMLKSLGQRVRSGDFDKGNAIARTSQQHTSKRKMRQQINSKIFNMTYSFEHLVDELKTVTVSKLYRRYDKLPFNLDTLILFLCVVVVMLILTTALHGSIVNYVQPIVCRIYLLRH
jgi:hypothetical protein